MTISEQEMTDEELLELAMANYQKDLMDVEDQRAAPQQMSKDSQFKFMREILRTAKSTKVGNLDNTELGKTDLTQRGALKVALISEYLDLDEWSTYYRSEAEIISATSMSKKAKFLELIFTQIRKSVTGIDNKKTEPKKAFSLFKKGDTSE